MLYGSRVLQSKSRPTLNPVEQAERHTAAANPTCSDQHHGMHSIAAILPVQTKFFGHYTLITDRSAGGGGGGKLLAYNRRPSSGDQRAE